MRRLIIITICIMTISGLRSQSLLGTTGWLNIPTAEMQEDGTFITGASYVNKNYLANYGGGNYDAISYYLNLTFLPFLEVNFGNTHLLNYDESNNTVDRNFSFRLRAVRERKYVPAIVVGVHDLYTSIAKENETNQYFSSLYIVATKHIGIKKSEFGLTLGYGFDAFQNNQYVGVFGGLSFSPGFARELTLIGEYDGDRFNVGANVLFFKHLFVYAMLEDVKYFSGGIAYRVYLLNNFKEKKKAENR